MLRSRYVMGRQLPTARAPLLSHLGAWDVGHAPQRHTHSHTSNADLPAHHGFGDEPQLLINKAWGCTNPRCCCRGCGGVSSLDHFYREGAHEPWGEGERMVARYTLLVLIPGLVWRCLGTGPL